ncbi:MAG TPA: zinc-binding dehydrogenase, partial [bacterium]
AKYPFQADLARRFGADDLVEPDEKYEAAARITGAKLFNAPMNKGMLLGGFDVVYDCVGSAGTVEDGLRFARAGGTVVLVGVDLRRMRLDLNPVWYQEVDLIGSQGHGMDAWQGRKRHTYDWVVDWLRSGKMRGDGIITHRFPFEEHRRAVDTAVSKARNKAVKIVFDYSLSV